MWLCYIGVFPATTIDAVLPHHHPSLFCSSPSLNNTLILLIFVGSHRYVELFSNVYMYTENFSAPLEIVAVDVITGERLAGLHYTLSE